MAMTKRERNALNYISNNWNAEGVIGNLFRLHAINKTIQLIQDNILSNGVLVCHNENVLNFKCFIPSDLNVSWKFAKCSNGENAYYDKDLNCIVLNEELIKDGIKAYEALFHEYTHKIQFELCKHIQDYVVGSAEYDYINTLQYDAMHIVIDGGAFGYNFSGDSYISPIDAYSATMTDMPLIEAMYAMQSYERSAYQTGKNAREFVLSLHPDKEFALNYGQIQNEKHIALVQTLQSELGCQIDYYQLCTSIDKAKNNIITRKSPSDNNDVEALISYDIAAILMAQNNSSRDSLFVREEYQLARLHATIANKLATFYENEGKVFAHPCDNQRIGSHVFSNDLLTTIPFPGANDLHLLSTQKQAQNPKLIVEALKIDRELAVAEIKCIDIFKMWYHSELNDLSSRDKEIVSELMGSEFAIQITEHDQTLSAPAMQSDCINEQGNNEQYVFDGDPSVFVSQINYNQGTDCVERNF